MASGTLDVAEVFVVGDGSMVQVEARSAGTATITAYAADGSAASCTVTVEAPYVPPVTEDPLTLNQKNITIEEGEWGEIYVTGGRCVDWNTTNPNVVRLYDVGDPTLIKIKGESAGTAEIIAYAPDGTTTICKITVTAYVEPITIVDSDPLYFDESGQEITSESNTESYEEAAADDITAG